MDDHQGFADRTRVQLAASVVTNVGVIAVAVVLSAYRHHLAPAVPPLALMLFVLVAAFVGGRTAAIVTAATTTLAYNIGFIDPVGTLRIHLGSDVVVLAVYMAVAASTGTLLATVDQRRAVAAERTTEVERLNEELRSSLEETRRLRREADRAEVLEEIDRHRRLLLRSVSHDLRTPLATILGVASDLADPSSEHSPDVRRRLLELVVIETQRLDAIVANLLSFSRVEAGALLPDRRPVDIGQIVRGAVRRLELQPRRPVFRVRVDDDDLRCDADGVQIDQVVSNLLDNACRWSTEGQDVDVTVRRIDGWVSVVVGDRGTGILPGVRDSLFTPFVSAAPGHPGLGLAICRAIVEAHGGKVHARDRVGGGTEFEVELPHS